jgi:hypothetical protein
MTRESDMLESGTRELTGEWVVGTDVWRRLKSQRRSKNDGKRATSTDYDQRLAIGPDGIEWSRRYKRKWKG